MMNYEGQYHMDGDIVRWNSNNRIPFEDMLERMYADGAITGKQQALSVAKRQEEDAAFLADYRERMANHVPSDEEMFEMKAAFGEGAEVVNVITGQKIQL